MNNYTKGNWEIRGNKIFVESTYKSIATLSIQRAWDEKLMPVEDTEAKANAKLISAAPDMLEALEEILNDLAPRFNFDFNKAPVSIRKAKAAIKKAKGE